MTVRTNETYSGGVVVRRLVDNGDGTGTLTLFNAAGQQTSQQPVTGLPPFDPSADNAITIRQQAQAALATNATALGQPDPTPGNTTYLAIGAPTNAQVVAQVRALTQQNNVIIPQLLALTQQMNKVIRLVIGQLDSTT